MEGARKNILAAGVSAKQMDKAIINAEQMDIAGNETEDLIVGAGDEELHIAALIFIYRLYPTEIGFD